MGRIATMLERLFNPDAREVAAKFDKLLTMMDARDARMRLEALHAAEEVRAARRMNAARDERTRRGGS